MEQLQEMFPYHTINTITNTFEKNNEDMDLTINEMLETVPNMEFNYNNHNITTEHNIVEDVEIVCNPTPVTGTFIGIELPPVTDTHLEENERTVLLRDYSAL
jgi:hypothetical protein